MRKFVAFADAVNRRVGHAAAWLVVAMTAVVFAMIVLSAAFRLGWVWMRESVTYMHGVLFMAAAGYTLLRDEHVRIDVFYAKFSPRGRAWVNLLGFVFLLAPVCVFILWTSAPYVADSWKVLERSDEASGLPALFLLKSFLLIFPALMILQGLSLAFQSVLVLRGEQENAGDNNPAGRGLHPRPERSTPANLSPESFPAKAGTHSPQTPTPEQKQNGVGTFRSGVQPPTGANS